MYHPHTNQLPYTITDTNQLQLIKHKYTLNYSNTSITHYKPHIAIIYIKAFLPV